MKRFYAILEGDDLIEKQAGNDNVSMATSELEELQDAVARYNPGDIIEMYEVTFNKIYRASIAGCLPITKLVE